MVVRQDDGVLSAGTVGSSVLNLIAATLGAGTITMPYIICRTGIAFGCILTIMGGFLSYYSSMLLIKCAELTGKRNYEDFAEVAFGSKHWRTVVSVTMMVSLLGFTTAYISLSKTLIPNIVVDTFGRDEKENLSVWLQNNETSRKIWATVFTFCILLPLAMFRKLSMLRYMSFFGVLCSIILMFVLCYEFAFDKAVV